MADGTSRLLFFRKLVSASDARYAILGPKDEWPSPPQQWFEMGLWRRDVVGEQLIHHSDKGSQYTSLRFTQRLADAGVSPSTGSVGDSYDNAMAESFFSTIKTELIYRHSWTSRHDAELAIFAWIEGWYNPERIMAILGMRSPDEFEKEHYAATSNTNHDTLVMVGSHELGLQ